MKYLVNNSTDPHYNMAFDEFCLEQLPLDEPVFYLWKNRPSVIIGLNQNCYSEVNLKYLEDNGITLARRVTGGGAVYHDLQNLNYTITGRSDDLERDYPGYMSYMLEALRQLGVDAELSGRNDIMVDGRKVSGYAKRVYKDRLMVHGTLMYNVDIETLTEVLNVSGSKLESAGIASVHSRVANLKDYLPQFSDIDELKDALREKLSAGDPEVPLSDGNFSSIRALADEKFSTWEWNYGHSMATGFHFKRKFACGTVQADFEVNRGVITSFAFGGDFLGNLPADPVAARLVGCKYTRRSILDILQGSDVPLYFDSMDPSELADMIMNGLQ